MATTTTTSSSNKDEITALEYSTLKVPYELLNKKFRSVQKVLDREIVQATSDCSTPLPGQPALTEQDVDSLLVKVSGKLVSLKRKVGEVVTEEVECVQVCKTRLDHIKAYASGNQTETAKGVWLKNRENRILVDHLLRHGHYSAALRLAQSSDIEQLVDTEIFFVCQTVEEGLRNHDTGPCLAYCHEHRSKLRRNKSQLEFQVRLQDFIELIRTERRVEAIKYARKHFSSGNEQFMQEIERAMGLLAYSPATKCKRYQKLFSKSRWSELVILFRQENFNLFQLSPHSILTSVLQAGLSALKTPQCYKTEEFNSQCPVCSTSFNELAKSLPFAHCSQSYLICNLSGEPMNEHNPPLMLPNGYVYGEKGLKDMSLQNDGEVTCPRTKKTYKFSDAKKVYVM